MSHSHLCCLLEQKAALEAQQKDLEKQILLLSISSAADTAATTPKPLSERKATPAANKKRRTPPNSPAKTSQSRDDLESKLTHVKTQLKTISQVPEPYGDEKELNYLMLKVVEIMTDAAR